MVGTRCSYGGLSLSPRRLQVHRGRLVRLGRRENERILLPSKALAANLREIGNLAVGDLKFRLVETRDRLAERHVDGDIGVQMPKASVLAFRGGHDHVEWVIPIWVMRVWVVVQHQRLCPGKYRLQFVGGNVGLVNHDIIRVQIAAFTAGLKLEPAVDGECGRDGGLIGVALFSRAVLGRAPKFKSGIVDADAGKDRINRHVLVALHSQ